MGKWSSGRLAALTAVLTLVWHISQFHNRAQLRHELYIDHRPSNWDTELLPVLGIEGQSHDHSEIAMLRLQRKLLIQNQLGFNSLQAKVLIICMRMNVCVCTTSLILETRTL
jgi:hypothetical protein